MFSGFIFVLSSAIASIMTTHLSIINRSTSFTSSTLLSISSTAKAVWLSTLGFIDNFLLEFLQ
jgi:hypothetical protein